MIYRLIANGLTTLRILLTPVFIFTAYLDKWPIALAIAAGIGITDILDGKAAKLGGNTGLFGSIYDITADFIFIFSSFILLYLKGILSIFTILFVPASLGLFLYLCLRNKKITKTFCGRYTGAVCILVIIAICFIRIIPSIPHETFQIIIESVCVFYLFLSILENIFILKKSSQKQS
jgi:phosphatidylglycerophosphate synthase